MPAIMKAARQPIREIAPAPAAPPYTFAVRALSPPVAKGHAEMVTGSIEEQAKKLAALLRDKGFVRR